MQTSTIEILPCGAILGLTQCIVSSVTVPTALSSLTTDVTITIPNASTTLVGIDNSQTLTNKTLIDSTNNVMASS